MHGELHAPLLADHAGMGTVTSYPWGNDERASDAVQESISHQFGASFWVVTSNIPGGRESVLPSIVLGLRAKAFWRMAMGAACAKRIARLCRLNRLSGLCAKIGALKRLVQAVCRQCVFCSRL